MAADRRSSRGQIGWFASLLDSLTHDVETTILQPRVVSRQFRLDFIIDKTGTRGFRGDPFYYRAQWVIGARIDQGVDEATNRLRPHK